MPLFHQVPVDIALTLGVTSIEHAKAAWPVVLRRDLQLEYDAFMASGQPYESGEEFMYRVMSLGEASVSPGKLARLAEFWATRKAYLCPTLLATDNWRRNPPPKPARLAEVAPEQWARSFEGFHEASMMLTRELARHGVKMLVGQDGVDSEGVLKEMELLDRAGVNAVEIIRGATIYPASWMGAASESGSIGPGQLADVVVLEKNPLDGIENIRSTWMVIANGQVAFGRNH